MQLFHYLTDQFHWGSRDQRPTADHRLPSPAVVVHCVRFQFPMAGYLEWTGSITGSSRLSIKQLKLSISNQSVPFTHGLGLSIHGWVIHLLCCVEDIPGRPVVRVVFLPFDCQPLPLQVMMQRWCEQKPWDAHELALHWIWTKNIEKPTGKILSNGRPGMEKCEPKDLNEDQLKAFFSWWNAEYSAGECFVKPPDALDAFKWHPVAPAIITALALLVMKGIWNFYLYHTPFTIRWCAPLYSLPVL